MKTSQSAFANPLPEQPGSCFPKSSRSDSTLPDVAYRSREWDEIMRDMCRDLEQICGSRRPVGDSGFSSSDSVDSRRSLCLPVTEQQESRQMKRSSSMFQESCSISDLPVSPGLSRRQCNSYPEDMFMARTGRAGTIFVRHIETHKELQNKLSQICLHRSPAPEVENRPPLLTTTWHEIQPKTNETSATGHLQVRVGQVKVEELVVSVRDGGQLIVESISGSGMTLYETILTDAFLACPLLCRLTGNGLLCVYPHSPSKAEVHFVGTGKTFIPVIQKNETKLEVTVVLHIPYYFQFDDITVKTVDNRLEVTGKKRSVPLSPVDTIFSSSVDSESVPFFRVLLQLPNEVNSRSVTAAVTENQQLIITGQLDHCHRRSSYQNLTESTCRSARQRLHLDLFAKENFY